MRTRVPQAARRTQEEARAALAAPGANRGPYVEEEEGARMGRATVDSGLYDIAAG
jgi:hypothetical protein